MNQISQSYENKSQGSSWTIDSIIQKFFPILGVLMMVGGLGYFFYDGFWGNISISGRLGLGFLLGLGLVIGGYSFTEKLKKFADIVIGGGILTLYATLIYGTRFEFASDMQSAVFPESMGLMISALFCAAIAFYSIERKSKTILILGMLGAYLTPFFIGQIGESDYQTSFTGFLLYYLAISVSLFFASFRMNLLSLMTANILGLFVGTLSLSGYIHNGFAQTPHISAIIAFVIVAAHLAFVTLNTKKFAGKQLVSALHFVLPFIWFSAILFGALENQSLEIFGELSLTGILMALVSAGYFMIWNTLDTDKIFSQKLYTSIYIMGFVAGALAFMDIAPIFGKAAGLFLSLISLVFAVLFSISSKSIREIAFLATAVLGFVLVFLDTQEINGTVWIFEKVTLLVSLSLSPFLLHFALPKGSEETFELRKGLGVFSGILIALFLGLDIFEDINLRYDFLFFTIPALVLALLALQKKDFEKAKSLTNISLGLLALGYFLTFFTFWDKIFPAHRDTFLSTQESMIGVVSLFTAGILLYWVKKNSEKISLGKHFLFLAFVVVIIFQLISHEIIGLYNNFFPYNYDITSDMRGLRALVTSFWWILLASVLIFVGIKNIKKFPHEKRIGMALMAISFGKILLYDMSNVETNLKVLLFVITGGILLSISYFSHVKK